MMEDAISPNPSSTLALLVQAVRRSCYEVLKLIKEDVSVSKEDTLPSNLERLLNWFEENNAQLNAWVSCSEIRAQLMLVDPLTAIQQAGLQISGDLIPELRNIAKAIGGN